MVQRVSFCLNLLLLSLNVPVKSHVLHLLLFDVCRLKESAPCLIAEEEEQIRVIEKREKMQERSTGVNLLSVI